jgi:hypothetical protein
MQNHGSTRFVVIAALAGIATVRPERAVADPAHDRCKADALNPAVARARLEWARQCGTRVNLVSATAPRPPAFSYDTGIIAADGVTHLIEYIETDDFWGMNSYSGVDADVNGTFSTSQWRPGPITTGTDASGFQTWSEASTLAVIHPEYPTFGTNPDVATATPLYPHPNYALQDCRLYADAAGLQLANTSATGFFVTEYCDASDVLGARCADGTQEQVFGGGMVGCAGAVSFADRATLCGPGFRVVSAAEWVALRGGIAPVHDYWTSNDLKFSGNGTSACSVSPLVGVSCGATPMRVCTAAGTDAEGNQCNWQHCGLEASAPDQFFGGCAGNLTAGALCIVAGCADGTVEQIFAGGMVGCAATETYANRASLCGPGFRLATAAEWVALRGGIAPTHDYWTSDALKFSGSGSSACTVSTTVGNDCGATPMRVCTAAGGDAEGNVCNWTHCGLDASAPDQFFGGCVFNTTAGAVCVPSTGCADGSVEQVFEKGMVGCAGSVAYGSRASLCGSGYQPATAAQWVANRGGAVPNHDYWTDDSLKWGGSGPSACFVSNTTGSDTCGASPMRVCTTAGSDPEGNTCTWTHCGLDANAPDQFFGGCISNAGTLCMPALQATTVAQATSLVLNPRYAITERHAAHGAVSAGSIAAAAMMAAQGYSNRTIPTSWESSISASCASRSGTTTWPAGCRPAGMAAAITAFTASDWEAYSWASTDRTSALNQLAQSLQAYQSPVAAPIFGQADHWVAVTQLTATLNASTWTVSQVKFLDGGPPGSSDSSFNSYMTGLAAVSGSVWANVYYTPTTAINPACDPCTADPSYNRYTMVFDPPRGAPSAGVAAVFAAAPPPAAMAGRGMTEQLAHDAVRAALTAAGLDADPAFRGAIDRGAPGSALRVRAGSRSGAPWSYYLVPILAGEIAVAFVQLDGADGSFAAIEVPATPARFHPVSASQAERRARRLLAGGERLTAGVLTWDPRGAGRLARSPARPYYEFGVTGATGAELGVVRVALDAGAAQRSRPVRPAR